MLYNTAWETKTKPDVFSLESLISWLETQPADRAYDWHDIDGCLSCLYLREFAGIKRPAEKESPYGNNRTMLDSVFPNVQIYGEVGHTQPWTFGAALKRARAALS